MTRNAKPSIATLTPPVPKRTAAQTNTGNGSSNSTVIVRAANGPNTANVTRHNASASRTASRQRRHEAVFNQAAPRVTPMTTAGTQMKLVNTFDRNRVCQTSRKSCATPFAVTAAASANDTRNGAATAKSRNSATPRAPSNGVRPRAKRRTPSAASAPSARLLK
jgi:hypothetical protein